MDTNKQRYIFTDFDSIQCVKFKKLEKVCNKIFILINIKDDWVPFSLVRNLQNLGKAVKWIPVENNKNLTLNYHICYLIGKMHSKINKDIEFAVLSDDDAFDPMIAYINSNKRICRRVKTGGPKKLVTRKVAIKDPVPIKEEPKKEIGERANNVPERELVHFNQPHDYEVAYQQTKDRLKLVSTRPYNITSLRDYIHINNQELVERGKLKVEEVIDLMETNEEINIKNGVVEYMF